MKRKIIHIDAGLCNGCGACIPNCPEGALQMIDGKARLVSDLFCDGLGACIGECPAGAIRIEEREAEPYSERRVMENIVTQGENTIRAHLRHLKEHGETGFLEEAQVYLREKNIAVDLEEPAPQPQACGCAGTQVRAFRAEAETAKAGCDAGEPAASELRQWPVQLHLVPPSAPYFRDADVVLAADCVAYAYGDFHRSYLRGRRLAIACPKLDSNQDVYLDKLTAMIDFGGIRSLTVLTMEVPCCRALLQLARQAASAAKRKIPVEWVEVGIQGDVLKELAVG
jgi:ferredoxin